MAYFTLNFRCSYQKKSKQVLYPSVFAFVSITTISSLLTQASASDCVLDIHQFSFWNTSDCEAGNWGGFVNNCSCGAVFDDYLYALAQRANRTQKLFLNATEQENCHLLMSSIGNDVSGCGFQKLTSGGGGCSDFSTEDVYDNLGNTLNMFDQDCKLLGSPGNLDTKACSSCSKRWGEIILPVSNLTEFEKMETMVCGFSVLITLIGSRTDDGNWIHALYECLGGQNFSLDERSRGSDDRKLSTGLWILAGGLVGTTVIIVLVIWILCKERVKESLQSVKEDYLPSMTGYLRIPIMEVHLATNNLDPSNFIGQGVAGKVYKGELSNGHHVAVKHIINDRHVDTFVREVRSLSHVRHPNLVSLLGYCEAADECFLVYELCHNGNLSEWIFGKDKTLSWVQRLQIAIDSAKGLLFLHTYPGGCIVHRDIKPTNILINAKFRAKLADFGLSKVMDLDQSYVSSEVRGTLGYVDPEYRRNHRVYPSADVYSFGIVILQLLSGQRAISFDLSTIMPLTKMARSLTNGGNIEEFADPKLERKYSSEAFELVFKLALSCTRLKQQRPSIKQVVSKLENALDISTQYNSVT